MRRAHSAMLDSRSHDLLTLARVALEAVIRSGNDLFNLLNDANLPHEVKAPIAAAARAA
jgi:hypothetical protein